MLEIKGRQFQYGTRIGKLFKLNCCFAVVKSLAKSEVHEIKTCESTEVILSNRKHNNEVLAKYETDE